MNKAEVAAVGIGIAVVLFGVAYLGFLGGLLWSGCAGGRISNHPTEVAVDKIGTDVDTWSIPAREEYLEPKREKYRQFAEAVGSLTGEVRICDRDATPPVKGVFPRRAQYRRPGNSVGTLYDVEISVQFRGGERMTRQKCTNPDCEWRGEGDICPVCRHEIAPAEDDRIVKWRQHGNYRIDCKKVSYEEFRVWVGERGAKKIKFRRYRTIGLWPGRDPSIAPMQKDNLNLDEIWERVHKNMDETLEKVALKPGNSDVEYRLEAEQPPAEQRDPEEYPPPAHVWFGLDREGK